MTEDDKLYIDWMLGMVIKEREYPNIVDFWLEAINEYIKRKVLNRGKQHLETQTQIQKKIKQP